MKVLVTGGAGFIGSHTARALVSRGDDVRVVDALTEPVHDPGADPAFDEGIEFLRGDVRNADDWRRALDGVETVVHLAAYQDYLTDFSKFFHVNAAGTALCYEMIVADHLPVRRIVVASSQAVYGEGAVLCPRDGVQMPRPRSMEELARGRWNVLCPLCGGGTQSTPTAEDAADPSNSYGISKIAAERVALALGETYGIETVALRYSIVHGPGQSPRNAYSGLLRSAALRLRAGRPPLAFEDGLQLRDYVAIEDVVSANLLALDHPQAPGKAYNVGGGRAFTVLSVIEALMEISGVDLAPSMPGAFRVGDVRNIVSDTSRLRSLGWRPREDLNDVWRKYWTWLDEIAPREHAVEEAHERMRREGVLRQVSP